MQRKFRNSFLQLFAKNIALPQFGIFNLRKEKPKPRQSAPRMSALSEVTAFGRNPGNIEMLEFLPRSRGVAIPLVVVLHGCQQNARDFDEGTGWTSLAATHGFAVVFAQQKSANNPNLCFNWFRPSQMRRDRGELGSVQEMIVHLCDRHPIDPSRIYVVGLSAGAALASALLATYPARFSAGALVAGLPFGAARDAMTALSVMHNGVTRTAAEWGDMIREVSPDVTSWPSLSIWHGTADSVVVPANGKASLDQWLNVHQLTGKSGDVSRLDGARRSVWRRADGSVAVEFYELDDVGHGMPVARSHKAKRPANETEKYLLASSLPVAEYLVSQWGLAKAEKKRLG